MTTDERIDRLVERHEALAQSVESLLATTRDNQQMIVSVAHSVERLAGMMDRLLDEVVDHEHRIRTLEARPQ